MNWFAKYSKSGATSTNDDSPKSRNASSVQQVAEKPAGETDDDLLELLKLPKHQSSQKLSPTPTRQQDVFEFFLGSPAPKQTVTPSALGSTGTLPKISTPPPARASLFAVPSIPSPSATPTPSTITTPPTPSATATSSTPTTATTFSSPTPPITPPSAPIPYSTPAPSTTPLSTPTPSAIQTLSTTMAHSANPIPPHPAAPTPISTPSPPLTTPSPNPTPLASSVNSKQDTTDFYKPASPITTRPRSATSPVTVYSNSPPTVLPVFSSTPLVSAEITAKYAPIPATTSTSDYEQIATTPSLAPNATASSEENVNVAPLSIDSEQEGSPALKSGLLMKQNSVNKKWSSRYFVLFPSCLCYYKDISKIEHEKKIYLDAYEMLVVDTEESEKDFCFKLMHPSKRTYYLHSDTKGGMLDWIIAIQDVIDKLKPDPYGSNPDLKLKEQSVSENHEKYELVYAMLNAIRFSVGKVAALPYLDIGLEELNTSFSLSVSRQGGSAAVPGSNFSYDFTDYAPKAFRKLREIFGFNCADYLVSLTSQYSLSELPTPGKSGSFFYYSSDKKLLLKTISSTEFDDLRRMLPNYFLHILQHPNTLLTRLYGLHKISTEKIRNTFFVVMENIFSDYEMDETYDLKGSTIGRKAESGSLIKKDLDLNRRILLGAERRNALLHQLEIDCKYLEKNNIMDYSFLLGIRFISNAPEPNNNKRMTSIFQKERGGYQSTTEGNEFHGIVYYIGIIDIFTTYNIKKQLEHTYKSTVYETKDEISVVDAAKYADRFKKFIGKITGWKLTENSQDGIQVFVR